MMLRYFDETLLLSTLQALAPVYRAAFAASCADRHAIFHQTYVMGTAYSAGDSLGSVLDRLWNDLLNNSAAADSLNDDLSAVMKMIPPDETQVENGDQRAAAEDAASAAAYAIRARLYGSAEDAMWAARRCYERADRTTVNELSGTGFKYPDETLVLSHPRVQTELRLQKEALDILSVPSGGESAKRLEQLRLWTAERRYDRA